MAQHDSPPVGVTEGTTLRLPPGVRHHSTASTAETTEIYDALPAEERAWEVEQNHTYPDGIHRQKELDIDGMRVVVFPARPRS